MAPQKTMAISQQQQQPTILRKDSGDQLQSAKARKRKQQQQALNSSASQQQQQPADTGKQQQKKDTNGKSNESPNNNNKENLALKNQVEKTKCQQQAASVVPSERTNLNTNKKQQQTNQVPTQEKKELPVPEKKSNPTFPNTNTILAKQLSDELPDDIDAGIELDGSSNSGSSVKDMNEEQSKSTSVSPVMAHSNLVNENRNQTTQHAVEVAPLEQLTGSLCTEVAPTSKKISSSATTASTTTTATTTTTKQQLAANQQVIDADEQLLQQKLQNKQQQRKSSLQSNTSLTNISANGTNLNTSQSQHNTSVGAATPTTPQSPALCKVCGQHVYQMERMLAEKSIYHKRCFRCYQCKIQLRVDNYSSHEGQVYCKAHHRQLFQPQVRLDNEDDVDIVAKSTTKTVDDYLTHRGRLSELSFSFLQTKPEGIRKRQMIICENEPAELPKDVVRCDTKVDDGIDQLKLNLNNILEKFERQSANNGEDSQPSSAGIVIEKPSINIKKTLMAFETKSVNSDSNNEDSGSIIRSERPVVKKLTNSSGFLNRQNSTENSATAPEASPASNKPLAIRRSESLMQRLKKYESRIAGEQVVDDDDDDDENANENGVESEKDASSNDGKIVKSSKNIIGNSVVPKKLTSINLSTLKSQWESGDINKRRVGDDDSAADDDTSSKGKVVDGNLVSDNGNSPLLEKQEELSRIRQQLACRKSGDSGSSIKNIYENAIREAQLQQTQQASRRNSSDLLALNGFSTSEIQQQLLQHNNGSNQQNKTPTSSPNKDHFQLNFSNKANKLKERFEQGLINNNSQDDSDQENGENEVPTMTKLDQIRQEKLEDLSVFTEGEIKAREARSMFQQIDRRLSAANGGQSQAAPSSRSLSSISASMRTKLLSQMNSNDASKTTTSPAAAAAAAADQSSGHGAINSSHHQHQQEAAPNSKQPVRPAERQPIRLTNNVGK